MPDKRFPPGTTFFVERVYLPQEGQGISKGWGVYCLEPGEPKRRIGSFAESREAEALAQRLRGQVDKGP